MQTLGKFPSVRMRRMRHDDFSRRLMRESRVSVDDLIYPVFVIEGNNKRVQVPSMPGVERLSLDLLLKQAEECVKLGIPVMALFPSIDASLKTPDGREAANPDGFNPSRGAFFERTLPGTRGDVRCRTRPLHNTRSGRPY